MRTFPESINEYREQLQKGAIQQAYRGLIDYMQSLRVHFKKKYPDFEVPGNLYSGYMDMTYFAIIPPDLKRHKLKVAVVFLHEAFRFEVWLSGANRQVQVDYSNLLRGKGWNKYKLTTDPKTSDSIMEHVLVAEPDFDDLNALTKVIEIGTVKFIGDLEDLLSELGS
jgi:hypothetical protein